MKIKCAIFDFDGTLFDSMYLWDTVGETYLRSLGKEPKPSVRDELKPLSLFQSACYLKDEYGITLSLDEIMTGINKTIEHFYFYEVLPKPGVIDLLKEMKKNGISLCIVTASERYHIEAALKRCGMSQYFDAIFTCTEFGHGKDEPLIFRHAIEYFHADRSNTVIFEDAIHAIKTAKNDDFKVIAIFDSSETHQTDVHELCDCYLADFEHTEPFWKFASDT